MPSVSSYVGDKLSRAHHSRTFRKRFRKHGTTQEAPEAVGGSSVKLKVEVTARPDYLPELAGSRPASHFFTVKLRAHGEHQELVEFPVFLVRLDTERLPFLDSTNSYEHEGFVLRVKSAWASTHPSTTNEHGTKELSSRVRLGEGLLRQVFEAVVKCHRVSCELGRPA